MNPSIQNSSYRWTSRAVYPHPRAAKWWQSQKVRSPVSGLICAVPSSMPDKSMCQHLFLCCQFFMVFDDISPIVRPATHAARSWPVCLFASLPADVHMPIWLNRPDIAPLEFAFGLDRIGVSSCWHGHRSVLFVWPLVQELWVPVAPLRSSSLPSPSAGQWWKHFQRCEASAHHCNWINFSGETFNVATVVFRQPVLSTPLLLQPPPLPTILLLSNERSLRNLNCLLFSKDLWQSR